MKTNGGIVQIESESDLTEFLQNVNAGTDYKDMDIVLVADIKICQTADWPGIGTEEHPFQGTFLGQNHSICNLSFQSAQRDISGLFGQVGAEATIQDLTVSCAGTCINAAGGIAGINLGLIDHCTVTGELRADVKRSLRFHDAASSGLGSIAGLNLGTISNCGYVFFVV